MKKAKLNQITHNRFSQFFDSRGNLPDEFSVVEQTYHLQISSIARSEYP
jgi:hypothetical protein